MDTNEKGAKPALPVLPEKTNDNHLADLLELLQVASGTETEAYSYPKLLSRLRAMARLRAATLADTAGLQTAVEELAADNEKLRDALEKIVQWANAYPVDVFVPPDWKAVRAALDEKGLTLDAVSAANMRHVLDGLLTIVQGALNSTSYHMPC